VVYAQFYFSCVCGFKESEVLKIQANYILRNVRKKMLSIFYIAVSQPGVPQVIITGSARNSGIYIEIVKF